MLKTVSLSLTLIINKKVKQHIKKIHKLKFGLKVVSILCVNLTKFS